MKFFALLATASAVKLSFPISMDPALDAAYNPTQITIADPTYSVKANEYTSWNGDSYTHTYDSTGLHGGANRIPVHEVPVLANGDDKHGHPKTEYIDSKPSGPNTPSTATFPAGVRWLA